MKMIEQTATKNPCYQAGRRITPQGVMIHSISVPQPDPAVIANNFNRPDADACVHAVIGADGDVYQLLPWEHRAWHCGSGPKGSANSTHISFEMTEPSTIRYTSGAKWVDENPEATRAHVLATYRQAVKLTAWLCSRYNLDPAADGVLLSHAEGHARGIASNHADVEHIWNREGLTMEQFRRDVAAAIAGGEGSDGSTSGGNTSDGGTSGGSGTSGSGGTSGGGSTSDGSAAGDGAAVRYIVQAGAFAARKNAERLVSDLQAAGFTAYIREL